MRVHQYAILMRSHEGSCRRQELENSTDLAVFHELKYGEKTRHKGTVSRSALRSYAKVARSLSFLPCSIALRILAIQMPKINV